MIHDINQRSVLNLFHPNFIKNSHDATVYDIFLKYSFTF